MKSSPNEKALSYEETLPNEEVAQKMLSYEESSDKEVPVNFAN